jgi:hypothetical protein
MSWCECAGARRACIDRVDDLLLFIVRFDVFSTPSALTYVEPRFVELTTTIARLWTHPYLLQASLQGGCLSVRLSQSDVFWLYKLSLRAS